MSLTIELPAEVEDVMRRRAEAAGQDLATFVRQVVTECAGEGEDASRAPLAPAEFARRLEAWIALHPVVNQAVDDSRESIYAGQCKGD
jgi:hypothetical protein